MYGQLWVSNDDRYFTTNDVDDTFAFVATGFQDTIRILLAGMWIQPLLPPEEKSVTIYGVTLSAVDSRLYDWESTLVDNS